MRDELADVVHPVFNYGLSLKERVQRGELLDRETEQGKLKGLLKGTHQAAAWGEYGGDGEHFLAGRYALACWLDDLFILDSAWSEWWKENALEWALYRTNERGWKFWEQARLAASRAGNEALEIFFLCVMLGFRGDVNEVPADGKDGNEKLKNWVESTREQITKSQGRDRPSTQAGTPPSYAPARVALGRFQNALLVAIGVFLVLVCVTAFAIVSWIGHG